MQVSIKVCLNLDVAYIDTFLVEAYTCKFWECNPRDSCFYICFLTVAHNIVSSIAAGTLYNYFPLLT